MAGSFGLDGLPHVVGLGDARRLPAQAAESIHQVAMAGRIDQGAVIVLAVNLDQRLSHLAQQLHAHAGVVDEGAAPSVGALDPAQDQGVIGGDAVLGQEREHRMAVGQVEHRRDLALARAAAYQRSVAAPANSEREGVEQDRLAGAGLAGQHRQALAEFEVEFVDQDDVADRQGG